ncbi:PqqD family protein [Acidobacteriota bacterium]
MAEKKNENQTQINLLKLVPVQNTKCEILENGRVILFKPKFSNSFMAKLLLPRMKQPYYKINLDEIGSFFWLNCDGTRTVREIAELHKNNFGEKVEPLYERIAHFIASLEKNRFIILK